MVKVVIRVGNRSSLLQKIGVFMPASVEILNVPIGSVLTSSIGANDEADKNDFTVLLIFSENVANLTESGITALGGCNACVIGRKELCLEREGASAADGRER